MAIPTGSLGGILGLQNPELLPPSTRAELEQLVASLQAFVAPVAAQLTAGFQRWNPREHTVALDSAYGRYLKVGKLVIAFFSLVWPTTVNGTNAKVEGLPFPVASVSPASRGSGAFNYISAAPGYPIGPLLILGESGFGIYRDTGAAVVNSVLSASMVDGFVMYETP